MEFICIQAPPPVLWRLSPYDDQIFHVIKLYDCILHLELSWKWSNGWTLSLKHGLHYWDTRTPLTIDVLALRMNSMICTGNALHVK